MADTKITALTAITTVDPAADVLPIVDVSDTSMAASGTTKKITSNQILGAGGTATLASATITGDLTVRTTRLTTTTTGVGIGTATPILPLDVRGTAGAGALFLRTTDPTAPVASAYIQTPVSTGFSSTVPMYGFWYQNCGMGNPAAENLSWIINSSEAMRLNSTGLGVGVASPSAKLHISGNLKIDGATSEILMATGAERTISASGSSGATALTFKRWDGVSAYVSDVIFNGSGNVGIGVTPSAWASGNKFIDINSSAAFGAFGSSDAMMIGNAYWNGSSWIRKTANNAWRFVIESVSSTPTMTWQLAANGSAGSSITWTQAMTLDASGNLLVGTTSASTTSGSGFKVTQPVAGHFDASIVTSASSSTYSCWDIYSTGGTAGYRFYVTSTGTINAVNTSISAISDARLKENVQDIDVGLGAILALKPRKFDWKAGKGKDIKGDRGFIAQEFEQVFPNLIDEWKDPAPEGEAPYKSVRQDLIPVLVKAIQELTARVQTLETR